VTGVWEKSAREARSWRDTNAFAQTSLDEKKSDTRMHSAIARAMKWGAIQNLPAPIVRRALSSIVSFRSTIFRRSPGRKRPSHAYLRLRSTFHPAGSQHYRGDHDQEPRLHFSDRFFGHLANCFRANRRHPRAISAAQRPRSEPQHIPRSHRCSDQSQTGPTQPLRQAGSFIDRRAVQQLVEDATADNHAWQFEQAWPHLPAAIVAISGGAPARQRSKNDTTICLPAEPARNRD
jgi:hypothetical protein